MRTKAEQEQIIQRALAGVAKAPVMEPVDEGNIVAVLIDSTVLSAPIWFALEDDWQPDPGDSTPIFYASELPMLRQKTPDELRAIYRVKAASGPGTRVRQ